MNPYPSRAEALRVKAHERLNPNLASSSQARVVGFEESENEEMRPSNRVEDHEAEDFDYRNEGPKATISRITLRDERSFGNGEGLDYRGFEEERDREDGSSNSIYSRFNQRFVKAGKRRGGANEETEGDEDLFKLRKGVEKTKVEENDDQDYDNLILESITSKQEGLEKVLETSFVNQGLTEEWLVDSLKNCEREIRVMKLSGSSENNLQRSETAALRLLKNSILWTFGSFKGMKTNFGSKDSEVSTQLGFSVLQTQRGQDLQMMCSKLSSLTLETCFGQLDENFREPDFGTPDEDSIYLLGISWEIL